MDTTKVPGHTRLYPDRLDMDSLGRPLLFATGVGGIGYDEHVLRWSDSEWAIVAKLGYSTTYLHPILSIDRRVPLLWQTHDELYVPGPPYSVSYLVSAEFVNDQYANLDTIGTVFNINFVYSGASSARRRWAIKSDGALGARAWYSDTARVWHGLFLPGSAGDGVAAAALDDTTALLVWIDVGGPLRWGTLRGSEWHDEGAIPGILPGHAIGPHFRRSPSGDLWLAWSATASDSVHYVIFRDGIWTAPKALRASMRVPGSYLAGEMRPSRDGWEQPVFAWVAFDMRRGFRGTVCVSVPTKQGYPVGENLPGTDDAIYAEAVRDSLGDTWLVWRTWDNGMFWTHSYVRATARSFSLEHRGRHHKLTWTLDEPAPDSWWTVLRSRNDGPFEEAARVQAGDGLELSWADRSPRRGHVRYRVRRDCLDTRYQWESEEVSWPPRVADRRHERRLPLLKPRPGMFGQEAELELADAEPGPVEIAVFDLQGRQVLTRTVDAAGEGTLRFSVAGASQPFTSGVYFARVRDSVGAVSNTVRLVILR